MQLFYVTHTVTTEATSAIIAKDENHLKEILADKEDLFRREKFVTKFQKDKSATIGYPLNADWSEFRKRTFRASPTQLS